MTIPSDSQKKKKKKERGKIKEIENRGKYLDLARELKSYGTQR